MPHPSEIAAERCPTDVQEYGQRNGLPEFARATWQAGFIDGYRFVEQRGSERGLCEGGIDVEAISDDDPCPKCGAELAEDCAPPQTVGGDAPRTISIDFEDIDAANAAYELIEETFGEWLSKNGGTLSVISPQTGGGGAGERARARLEHLALSCQRGEQANRVLIRDVCEDALAALRSSRREGAEAMRVDAAMAVRSIQGMTTSKEIADAIEALPIPGK